MQQLQTNIIYIITQSVIAANSISTVDRQIQQTFRQCYNQVIKPEFRYACTVSLFIISCVFTIKALGTQNANISYTSIFFQIYLITYSCLNQSTIRRKILLEMKYFEVKILVGVNNVTYGWEGSRSLSGIGEERNICSSHFQNFM